MSARLSSTRQSVKSRPDTLCFKTRADTRISFASSNSRRASLPAPETGLELIEGNERMVRTSAGSVVTSAMPRRLWTEASGRLDGRLSSRFSESSTCYTFKEILYIAFLLDENWLTYLSWQILTYTIPNMISCMLIYVGASTDGSRSQRRRRSLTGSNSSWSHPIYIITHDYMF